MTNTRKRRVERASNLNNILGVKSSSTLMYGAALTMAGIFSMILTNQEILKKSTTNKPMNTKIELNNVFSQNKESPITGCLFLNA